MHDHTDDNGPNLELNNFYGNGIINWTWNHGTLKFKPSNKNAIVVETWEAFKLSSETISQETFENTHLLPLSPPEKFMNHQACLADNQTPNSSKADEIYSISKSSIVPAEMEEIRKTDPMVILKVSVQ